MNGCGTLLSLSLSLCFWLDCRKPILSGIQLFRVWKNIFLSALSFFQTCIVLVLIYRLCDKYFLSFFLNKLTFVYLVNVYLEGKRILKIESTQAVLFLRKTAWLTDSSQLKVQASITERFQNGKKGKQKKYVEEEKRHFEREKNIFFELHQTLQSVSPSTLVVAKF